MSPSQGSFCRWYRPIGALLLLAAILLVQLRSCNVQTPVAVIPTPVVPTAVAPPVEPTVAPTAVPPTAPPVALPTLHLPAASDLTAEGLKLSGTGEPGATVELWDGATRIGTAPVGTDGAWSLVSKLGEGAHTLAIHTVDAAGNILNELSGLDITVPKLVALPKLNLPTAADLTAEGVRLSGTGEPGATVELWDGATKIGTALVGADGVWTLVSKLSEGAHALAVRTVDGAGNVLNELPTVDVTVPKALVVPTLNPPTVADFTGEGIKLSGTGEPGATVEVWEGTTRIGVAVVGVDGVWSLLGQLGEGAHKLAVITVDTAGNILNELPTAEVIVPAAQAPVTTEDLAASGVEYVVKWGDWLMKVARKFYGYSSLYTRIIEGTNAKAAVDSTFARITDPNHIEVGQKLWIPAMPGGK